MGFAKYAEDNYEIQEEMRMYTNNRYCNLGVSQNYGSYGRYWSPSGKMSAASFQRMKEAGVFKMSRK